MNETFYITKYFMTGGIIKIESACDADGIIRDTRRGFFNWFRIGRDAFRTMEEAVADCEKRRLVKIASLKKQITKIEKLTFV